MKKTSLLTTAILSLTALVLSACGAARSSGSSSSSAGGFRSTAARNLPLTPEAKLALGTIKLEGTPQAIDASMAANLLPLWQLMAQLNGSSSTAPQEVTAVLNQIQATMNPEQVKVISSMQLTTADIFTAFQASQTGGTSSGSSTAGGSQGGQGGGRIFFGGGGGPGGGGFGGGFGGNGATRSGTTTNGTGASATQTPQQAANQISLIVVNQVVQLLESRVKS
jgi:hypothetical protein